MLNAQVDLETLGMDDDAVIIQIGSVVYDDEDWTVQSSYDRSISIQPQIMRGRSITPDTVTFWNKQRDDGLVTPERWSDLFESQNRPSVIAADFSEWLKSFDKPLRLWSNHLLFDAAKLDNFLPMFGQDMYRNHTRYNMIEDLATLKYACMAKDPAGTKVMIDELYSHNKDLVQHNAVDDCVFQLRAHRAYVQFLRG